jgi:hypothetical protein
MLWRRILMAWVAGISPIATESNANEKKVLPMQKIHGPAALNSDVSVDLSAKNRCYTYFMQWCAICLRNLHAQIA